MSAIAPALQGEKAAQKFPERLPNKATQPRALAFFEPEAGLRARVFRVPRAKLRHGFIVEMDERFAQPPGLALPKQQFVHLARGVEPPLAAAQQPRLIVRRPAGMPDFLPKNNVPARHPETGDGGRTILDHEADLLPQRPRGALVRVDKE